MVHNHRPKEHGDSQAVIKLVKCQTHASLIAFTDEHSCKLYQCKLSSHTINKSNYQLVKTFLGIFLFVPELSSKLSSVVLMGHFLNAVLSL